MPQRIDGREADELRPVTIVPDYIAYPEGSVLITMGATKVLCNVTIEDGIPAWMRAQGVSGGWVTGEYALLPRSTQRRTPRETLKLGGRTQEIRRFIGRSLRAAVDLERLGTRTCIIDCDVLQADGGTRTAAVTGGYIALAKAINKMIHEEKMPADILKGSVAAVSVGVVNQVPMLDLNYSEDSTADVDINVVMTAAGEFIELQGTAEGAPFSRGMLDRLLELASNGISELITVQEQVLNTK
jgi:ribonuclease PH